MTTSTVHFALMANRSNGGFVSAITLASRLCENFDVSVWSLFGDVTPANKELLEINNIDLHAASPVIDIQPGDHIIFYMNGYPILFSNYAKQWREQLTKAASVQISFNRTLGTLPRYDWLAHKLKKVYFQDSHMQTNWQTMTRNNALASVDTLILAPPVELDVFLNINQKKTSPLVIGRLAGDASIPEDAAELYSQLANALPDAEFWFMPAPDALRAQLNDDRFRFFKPNEISVVDFLTQCDIYLLTYRDGVPIPGPRSLVEAMAAACAPIVVNREGPAARVNHGESGFCASSNSEFFDYTVRLAKEQTLRTNIATAARERARSFKIENWLEPISKTILTNS